MKLLIVLVFLAGCSARAEEPGAGGGAGRVTQLPAPARELGEELMLGLALAKNLHHKADVYLKEGRVGEAVQAVQQILSVRFPGRAPEAEDVLLDARARLAKLMIMQGRLAEAMRAADEGIASARRESFFLANLHSVRAEVLEARAAAGEEADAQAARADRLEAIRDLDRAIEIERALLDRLGEDPQ